MIGACVEEGRLFVERRFQLQQETETERQSEADLHSVECHLKNSMYMLSVLHVISYLNLQKSHEVGTIIFVLQKTYVENLSRDHRTVRQGGSHFPGSRYSSCFVGFADGSSPFKV